MRLTPLSDLFCCVTFTMPVLAQEVSGGLPCRTTRPVNEAHIGTGSGLLELRGFVALPNSGVEIVRGQLHMGAFNATNMPALQVPGSLVITAHTFGQIRSSQSERNVQIEARFY